MNRRKQDTQAAPGRLELEIAAAVAREKATQFHVTSALRLIELAADRVSPMRMLEIHMRLHWVVGAEAELLAYRVLAALGESAPAEKARLFTPGRIEPEHDPGSLWRVLRSRLRGRVHHDLRRWVELAVGQAHAGLVDIHVHHALRFARDLTETHSVADAAGVYADMVGVPVQLRQAFALRLVNELATLELPQGVPAPPPLPARETEKRVEIHTARLGLPQVV